MTGTREDGDGLPKLAERPIRFGLDRWYVRLLLAVTLIALAWPMDRAVAVWSIEMAKHGPELLTDFRRTAQQFGESMGIAMIAIAIWGTDRAKRRPLILAIGVIFLTGGIASGLKLLGGRERPHLQLNDGRTVWHGPVMPGEMDPDPSFPSGHTTAAFALALCLTRMYPKGSPAFVLLASLCGVSRFLSGKHFVTDALAGAWLGWEAARLMWDYQLAGLCRFIDGFVPPFSVYPAWDWDRMEQHRVERQHDRPERGLNDDAVHSLV